jgi:hypothetical protein
MRRVGEQEPVDLASASRSTWAGRAHLLSVALSFALMMACNSAARHAPPFPAVCAVEVPLRWAVGQERRTVRVSIDAVQGTRDGWQVEGKRRLASAIAEWNAVGLPVRYAVARQRDRAIEITVLVVPRLSVPSDDRMGRFHAGLTHLKYLGTGEISAATILIAEATPGGKAYSITDQMATLVHELGHALGLPHVANGVSVMSSHPMVSGVTRHDERLARSLYDRSAGPCDAIASVRRDFTRGR